MSKKYILGKRYNKFIPYQEYEIAKIEQWLSSLAEEGLVMVEGNVLFNTVAFECQEAQHMRYHIEAAKGGRVFDDNDGRPSEEQIELRKQGAWDYVGRFSDLYIYRTTDPNAADIDVDPEQRAQSFNIIKKKYLAAVGLLLLLPLIASKGSLILLVVSMGWWMALIYFLALAEAIRGYFSLSRARKDLFSERYCEPIEVSEKDSRLRLLHSIFEIVISVVLVATCILRPINGTFYDRFRVSLDEYDGTAPFATVSDFAGPGYTDYERKNIVNSNKSNTILVRHDLIAPAIIDYNETAVVKNSEGKLLDCTMYVNYCEMCSPLLANALARDLYRYNAFGKNFEPVEISVENADYAVAYINRYHFPYVIIQKGKKVIQVEFVQFQRAEFNLSFNEWAQIVCDGL